MPAPSLALQVLEELIKDPDPLVRRTAAESLGKIGEGSAEPALQRALNDPEPDVRAAAALALARLPAFGDGSARGIASLLRDQDGAVRKAAAQALGQADEAQAALVASVAELLGHPDAAVRRAAAQALFGMEGNRREAVDRLMRRGTDQDAAVRRWVIAALAESGEPRAVPALVDRLLHDDDDGVRVEAAYRLRFLDETAVLKAVAETSRVEASPSVQRWVDASRRSFTKASGSD
jgi:HEAT repeat protein